MATVTVTTTTSAESAKLWEVRDEPKDDQDTSMTEVAEEIIVEEHYETAIGDTHPPKDARPSAETGSGIDELTKQMSGVHLADERQPMTLRVCQMCQKFKIPIFSVKFPLVTSSYLYLYQKIGTFSKFRPPPRQFSIL